MARWLGPADALAQQAAWWVAVLGAARGAGWTGAAGFAAVALHLALRPGARRQVALVAAAAGAYGFLTDSALVRAGLVAFDGGGWSPAFMVGLWGAFGAGLTASLRAPAAWPPSRLAAVAALAGPLAYRAGAALGAMSLPAGPPSSLPVLGAFLAVAVQWAVGVPLLARLSRGISPDGAGSDTPAPAATAGRPRPRWAR